MSVLCFGNAIYKAALDHMFVGLQRDMHATIVSLKLI